MADIAELEHSLTLTAAVVRLETLRTRESLGDADDPAGLQPLTRAELLELLALQEIVARKAGYGRQLTVRNARAAGASWADIGQALGTSRQAAWEAHQKWIDGQAAHHGRVGEIGFDDGEAASARALAGDPAEGPAEVESLERLHLSRP
jgi:hypothetical protein